MAGHAVFQQGRVIAQVEIVASFGSLSGDRAALPRSCRATLEALYRHPIAHNLDWADVEAMLAHLGSVETEHNGEMRSRIGDERHRVGRRHRKDLLADDVMQLRHRLSRAGWGPEHKDSKRAGDAACVPPGDLLVVIEETQARLYHLDPETPDHDAHPIHPEDPSRRLRHLHHHDQGRDLEKRRAGKAVFHDSVAAALHDGGRIVVIGHGEGHSNAAHRLTAYLRRHHPEIAGRPVSETAADIARLSPAQRLHLGRRALWP